MVLMMMHAKNNAHKARMQTLIIFNLLFIFFYDSICGIGFTQCHCVKRLLFYLDFSIESHSCGLYRDTINAVYISFLSSSVKSEWLSCYIIATCREYSSPSVSSIVFSSSCDWNIGRVVLDVSIWGDSSTLQAVKPAVIVIMKINKIILFMWITVFKD